MTGHPQPHPALTRLLAAQTMGLAGGERTAVDASLASAARASAVRSTARPRALGWALVALLVSITVLQRLGINFGSYSLNASLLAMYGFLAVAAGVGALTISLPRLIAVTAGAAVALISTFANAEHASMSSLALLAAMYLPFVFVLEPRGGLSYEDAAELFGTLAWLCGIAGVLQFYAQFFLHGDWLFDFTGYLPAWLRGPGGFNTVIPVGGHFKSNGFFFREPSGFSFLMALALVMEWLGRRRAPRIAVFGLALLLTYSGTGLLALLIGVLIPLNRKTLVRVALLAAAGGVAFLLLDDALNLSFTMGRLDEFGSERSSGYIRYIAPGRLLADTAASEPATLWFGHGPGSISHKEAGFEFHDPTWAKLVFEYGIFGFVAFVGLFLVALRGTAAPLRVRAMLFAAWLVMGGHLLSPEQNFLTLALVGLFPRPDRREPPPLPERPERPEPAEAAT